MAGAWRAALGYGEIGMAASLHLGTVLGSGTGQRAGPGWRLLLELGQELQLSQPGGVGRGPELGAFSVAQLVWAAGRGGCSCS